VLINLVLIKKKGVMPFQIKCINNKCIQRSISLPKSDDRFMDDRYQLWTENIENYPQYEAVCNSRDLVYTSSGLPGLTKDFLDLKFFVRCDWEVATDYSFTCLSAIHVSVVVCHGRKLEFLSRAQSDWAETCWRPRVGIPD
jgi:hypothetical protein